MFKIIAMYVYTCNTICLYHHVYEYARQSLGSGTLAMHIDMHSDITTHAYRIISSFTYKCMAIN